MTPCNMIYGSPCNGLQGQSPTSDLEWLCIIPGHSMVNMQHLNNIFPSTMIFPCQHNYTNARYSFVIPHQSCVIVKINKLLNNEHKIGSGLQAFWRSRLPKYYMWRWSEFGKRLFYWEVRGRNNFCRFISSSLQPRPTDMFVNSSIDVLVANNWCMHSNYSRQPSLIT